MEYIIFDLEWNQPSDEGATIYEPLHLTGEIIELGAVKLNEKFELVGECKLYIRPQYYTKLHRRIASLTGIREKELTEQGLPFPEAFDKFMDFCGEDFMYMTWSTSDLPMLVENMLLHDMDVSQLPDYCDLQRVFCREIARMDRRLSLNDALKMVRIQGDTAHDALNDAKNTAKLCSVLDLESYLDEYVSRVFSEVPKNTLYQSRQEMLEDNQLLEFACPWCGEKVVCEPWNYLDIGEYVSLGTCQAGDEFWVQLYSEKNSKNEFRAKRLFFELSDDQWEVYQDKKQQQKV